MKKKTLIIFIALLVVVFLATTVHARGYKRWWRSPFTILWHAVYDLQSQIDTLGTGPQGPKGDKGDKGDKGEKGAPGESAPALTLLCPGCNFYGATLAGKNLSGAYLAGAIMYYTDLTGTNLAGTDLTGAHLYGAILVDTNMVGANLSGADLTSADLTGCIWGATICPDGTNTDANGGSCMNHLE